MRYHVTGAHRETGEAVELILEADTPFAAEEQANRLGLMVEKWTTTDDQQPGDTLADVVTALERVEHRIAMAGPRAGRRKISDLTTRDARGLITTGFWIAVGNLLLVCILGVIYACIVFLFFLVCQPVLHQPPAMRESTNDLGAFIKQLEKQAAPANP